MSVPPVQATVLSFEDARRVVAEHAARVRPGGTETVGLPAAAGCVLAEAVSADRDIPPFPRATRDGYAVRASDLVKVPVTLIVTGEIRAGESAENVPVKIGRGEAVSIMTGAPVPPGADAVVMVEYTSSRSGRVEITKSVAGSEN